MRHLPVLALSALTLVATACTVGDAGGDDDVPVVGEVSGSITTDQTWHDPITLVGDTTIEAGATVTIEAGTHLEAAAGVTLRVRGTLVVDGTAAAKVSLLPVAGATAWAGIAADSGAAVSLAHVEGTDVATLVYCHAGATCDLDDVAFTGLGKALVVEGTASLTRSHIADVSNGGVTVTGAGALTIRDSVLLTSSGDFVVQSGGSLDIEYSSIGEAQGSYEHCDLHIGAAASLRIARSNIHAGVYGMMLGNTDGAVIQYNNFTENGAGNDVSPVGPNTNADLRFNYWDQGAPSLGAGYDVSSPAATPISDAGPRV